MVCIDVIDDPSVLAQHAGPVCLLVRDDDESAVARAHAALGITDYPQVRDARHWRPEVGNRGGHLAVILAGLDDHAMPVPVEARATERVLLVVADEQIGRDLRAALSAHQTEVSIEGAVAVAALALARSLGVQLPQLADLVDNASERPRGFTRSTQRRQMRQLRSRLFRLRSLLDLQTQLLGHDEELHAVVPEADRPILKHARSGFAYARTMADQLYAGAGDVMAEQDSQISERLTLVSTVFLPLTVVTGFFGMNFAWMTDRLGSPWAFVLLGILTPLLVTVLTLVGVRRMGAGTPDR